MGFIKSKKGQIGTTITWVGAFLIIFFIMMLFVGFASLLAMGKVVPVLGSGRNEIKLESSSFSLKALESQRILTVILESTAEFKGDFVSVKDLVSLWAISDDAGKKPIEDIIDSKANAVLEKSLSEKEAACHKFTYDLVEKEPSGTISDAIFIIPAGGKKVEVKLKNGC